MSIPILSCTLGDSWSRLGVSQKAFAVCARIVVRELASLWPLCMPVRAIARQG